MYVSISYSISPIKLRGLKVVEHIIMNFWCKLPLFIKSNICSRMLEEIKAKTYKCPLQFSHHMLRTEASEQEAVITICKFMENRYPELKLLHHCPNGGKRDRVSAAVMKRQGVKAGVPDLHLPVPKGQYASLYIEMKYGDGRLQKEQKEFLKQAADYGNFVAVCYSQEIALKVIEDYVTLKTGEIMPIENNQVLKRWEEKKWQK